VLKFLFSNFASLLPERFIFIAAAIMTVKGGGKQARRTESIGKTWTGSASTLVCCLGGGVRQISPLQTHRHLVEFLTLKYSIRFDRSVHWLTRALCNRKSLYSIKNKIIHPLSQPQSWSMNPRLTWALRHLSLRHRRLKPILQMSPPPLLLQLLRQRP